MLKIKGFESKIAKLMQQREKMARALKAAEHDVAKWATVLEVALALATAGSCEEADVYETVRQKLEADYQCETVKADMQQMEELIAELRRNLEDASRKLQESDAEAEQLSARLEAAKMCSALADDSSVLTDLEEETLKAEGVAEANEEINEASTRKEVQKLDVEAEVARLLKKS